jgi:outer membrane protein TolC
VKLAEKNLKKAEEQFKLGSISLLDLDKSKLDYQNAQLNYNNKYYQLFRKQEERNLLLSKEILGKW